VNILVVEDDAAQRRVLEATVARLGHQVTVAENGDDAWRRLSVATFPVVLTDWLMEGGDGLDLCRRIRAAALRPYTYVIVLTGKGARADYLQAMDAGVDDFLAKPFDRDMLAARIHVAQRILGLRDHVEQLERLLPICMYCKKIRNSDEGWVRVEEFIRTRTSESFTHGICPGCYESVARPAVEQARRERRW
jgi:DNA-binding response OmpR family regulator